MNIKKVLFFKPGAIGDLLHTLPALKAFKRKYPHAHITVMVSPGTETLLQGTPVADRIQVFDKSKYKNRLKAFIDFAWSLRAERYDLFVDFQPSLRSWVLRRVSKARQILVYRKKQRTRGQRIHAAENFVETLGLLGISGPVEAIELPVTPEASAAADRFLAERGLDKSKTIIALNCSVGSARPARNWFPERFSALAERLIAELGASVVFVGGNEDRDLVKQVMSAITHTTVSAAGELTIAQTAALLSRCACLVSSDTGPLHLATAVGTPVVGLYGSTDPRRTGPIGRHHQVLVNDLSCVPCEEKDCPFGTRACMAAITVDEAFKAVQKAVACR